MRFSRETSRLALLCDDTIVRTEIKKYYHTKLNRDVFRCQKQEIMISCRVLLQVHELVLKLPRYSLSSIPFNIVVPL